MNLLAGNFDEEYDNTSLRLLPQFVSVKDDIINHNDVSLLNSYIWIGKELLDRASSSNNSKKFQELLTFIEPLQWEKQYGIYGDVWFFDFIDGTSGSLNQELYNKYITRIFSYPLTAERLTQKIIHGNQILGMISFLQQGFVTG